MALQVSLTSPFGRIPESVEEIQALFPDYVVGDPLPLFATVYPEAYARIMYVRAMQQETYIFVNWYADAAARERGDEPVKAFEYTAPTAQLTGDVYPAAYAWLKAQPEFAGALDV